MKTICILAIILSLITLISLLFIYLRNKRSESYLSDLGIILRIFPEIKLPENDVNYRKLEDVLVETMSKNRLNLNRSQIREILREMKNGREVNISSRSPKSILVRMLMDSETAPRLRTLLKYKLASVLKGIISNFVDQANLLEVFDNEIIFEKMANALKALHPIPLTSSQISSLLKMIHNSSDLFLVSQIIPEGEEYSKMYYHLDRPLNQDQIFSKFVSLLKMKEEEEDEDEDDF